MLKLAVGGVLLALSSQAAALSLGGVKGSAIIGRPLDILVQSSIDAAEAVSDLCLQASVSYSDTPVPSSATRVEVHKVGDIGIGALRIRVSLPINEPVVTVVLKAGCESNYSRSYTILADFEPLSSAASALPPAVATTRREPATPLAEPLPPGVSGSAQVRPGEPTGASASAAAKIEVSAPRPRPPNAAAPASKRKPTVSQASAATAASDKKEATKPEPERKSEPVEKAEAKGPRLELTPIDLSAAPATGQVLQAGSSAQSTAGAASLEGSATAPAAAPGNETTADPKLAAMSQEIEKLRADQERMRLTMEAVNAQLLQAREDRYLNPLVMVLVVLLLLALGGLVVLFRRRAQAATVPGEPKRPWWVLPEESAAVAASSQELPQMPPRGAEPVAASGEVNSPPPMPFSHTGGWIKGVEFSEATETQPQPQAVVDTAMAGDVQDLVRKVEFFESLDQPDDARQALLDFVRLHPKVSELPYLLLLQRLDKASLGGERHDVERLYEQAFHCPVPGSFYLSDDAPGVEGDADFMQRLGAVWPLRDALQLLEEALLSSPAVPDPIFKARSLPGFLDVLQLIHLWHGLGRPASQGKTEPLPSIGNAATGAGESEFLGWEPVQETAFPSVPAIEDSHALDIDLGAIEPAQSTPPAAQGVPAGNPEPQPSTELPSLEFDLSGFDFQPKAQDDQAGSKKP